jgi:hypothetical protein
MGADSEVRPLLWFRRAIVGVLLLGPTPAAQPQASHFVAADFVHGDFVHRAWRTHDGLPVNNVSSLLQSRDGYLWVGTFDGLVRFDGDRFVTFTTSDTEGLPSNRIAAMEEAADGTLWLRTSQDLLVRHDGREFTTITSAHGLGAEECTLMYRDRDDVLWLGTKLGVARYTGGRIERPYPDLPELYVRDLLASRDGSFWIATQSRGLLRLRGSELTILDEDTGLSSNHVWGKRWGEKVPGTSRGEGRPRRLPPPRSPIRRPSDRRSRHERPRKRQSSPSRLDFARSPNAPRPRRPAVRQVEGPPDRRLSGRSSAAPARPPTYAGSGPLARGSGSH